MSDRPEWSRPDESDVPLGWSPQQPPPAGPPPEDPSPEAPHPWASPAETPASEGSASGWITPAPPPPPVPPPPSSWGQAAWGPDPRGGYGRVGIIPLRPLTLGELLDGAVSAIRTHPRVMIGLSAVVAAITALLTLALTYSSVSDLSGLAAIEGSPAGAFDTADLAELAGNLAGGAMISLLLTGLASLILTGILTVVVAEAVLGRPVSTGAAWARTRPVIGRLIGVSLLLGVAVVAALALAAALTLVIGPAGLLLLLAAFVAITWAGVRVALAPVSIVLEGTSITGSLARSWRLVQGAWWRTFGVLVLAAIIAIVVAGIISVPFSLIAGALGDPTGFGPLLVSTLGDIAASSLTWPFTAAVTVLLYVDRRIRREGLDLELARAAGLTGGEFPNSSAGPVPPTGR